MNARTPGFWSSAGISTNLELLLSSSTRHAYRAVDLGRRVPAGKGEGHALAQPPPKQQLQRRGRGLGATL